MTFLRPNCKWRQLITQPTHLRHIDRNSRGKFKLMQYGHRNGSTLAQAIADNAGDEDDNDEGELESCLSLTPLQSTAAAAAAAQEAGAIDYKWAPESRYRDFLRFYCSNNALNENKWTDLARKLDTTPTTLRHWVQSAQSTSSVSDTIRTQFAMLGDEEGESLCHPQIVYTRLNGSFDLYWPPQPVNVPALHSLIVVDARYIACVVKHLSKTHLRALVIGHISDEQVVRCAFEEDATKADADILKRFPMLAWQRPTSPLSSDPYTILHSQHVLPLHARLKIPLIDRGVVNSTANRVVIATGNQANHDEAGYRLQDIMECEAYTGCRTVQSNSCARQNYYTQLKKKSRQSGNMDDEGGDDEGGDGDGDRAGTSQSVFPTGNKMIDLLTPLTKHGINLIVHPKPDDDDTHGRRERDVFQQILRHWRCLNVEAPAEHARHIIYGDVFDDFADAIQLQTELDNMASVGAGDVTVVAGHCHNDHDGDWHRSQTVVTCATLAKHAHPAENGNTLVIVPNANVFNECQNALHRQVCGGLSKFGFEHDDAIGHQAYDWIARKKDRAKPAPAPEFTACWGVEPEARGATYVIGVQMDHAQIQDIRIQPSAYFPWADSVVVLGAHDALHVAHSKSAILAQLESTDLSVHGRRVLHALRRLYSDCQVLKQVDAAAAHNSVRLWNDIFADANYAASYSELLRSVREQLQNACDNDGNELLNATCFDDARGHAGGEDEDQSASKLCIMEQLKDSNPLVEILQNAAADAFATDKHALFRTFTELQEKHRAMRVDDVEDDAYPHIQFRGKFDHLGFVKNLKMNVHAELFTDARCKLGMNIGAFSMLFINQKAVRMPKRYGNERKTAAHKDDGEDEADNEDMLSAFEQLSTCDAMHEFGLNVLRYEKGKIGNRHDFLHISGELKQDIYDASLFIFGYEGETGKPFIARNRIGPDALPVAAKKKKRKGVLRGTDLYAKDLETNDGEDESGQMQQSARHIIQTLQRKPFALTSK